MQHPLHTTKAPVRASTLTSPPSRAQASTPPVLQSTQLLGSQQAVDIEHLGQRYRLQATKAGKLILTK
ncbi:hemin uptake protein HemP [Rhodoferax aquaticus]|uniref:Hemin uptake protein HemP n=1 Tax=Rhodoferax aquaticus TaxID=2527691 RepID=A0A515END9_9BURK|nr:hemin uptake protein HemP [Rhodoferax aquaticus]QDL54175.1 hemin uptake protein HemP [Rhodoferax aquaticus]